MAHFLHIRGRHVLLGSMQDSFRDLYRQGELDSRKVVVDIPSARISMNTMEGPGGQALQV